MADLSITAANVAAGSGDYPIVLGIASSTTVLKLGINESGVAL